MFSRGSALKLDGRRNKMDFIRGFPGVAARFGITGMVYDGTPRPGAGDDNAEARGECIGTD